MKRLLVLMAIVATALALLPSAATAVTVTEEAWSYSEASLVSTSVSDVSSSIKGVLDLRYEVSNWKLPSGARKKYVRGWYNSYRNKAGKLVWLPKGNFYVYKSSLSPTGWRKTVCGNIVRPPNRPPSRVYRGKIRVYRYFTYYAKATASACVTATVRARASATANGVTAEAEGYASGVGYATATATGSGRTKVYARNSAVAGATRLVIQDQTSLKAKAQAEARLNLYASAWVRIIETSSTTPPPPPPANKVRIYVEKRQDSSNGQRLANWVVNGTLDGVNRQVQTSPNGFVELGEIEIGRPYNISEMLQSGWEIVSPPGGAFSGVAGNCDIYLTFVNRRIVCPPAKVKVYAAKFQDSVNGTMLAGWTINSDLDGSTGQVTTRADGYVLLGEIEVGKSYSVSEVLQSGWEIVSPPGGTFSGMAGEQDIYLRFVNRRCPPPPPPVNEFEVVGSVTNFQHLGNGLTYMATLNVTVLRNTNNDPVTVTWYVNGVAHSPTPLLNYPVTLNYNTVYFVTALVRDTEGNQRQVFIDPFNFPGPGEPPNVPMD